MEDLYCFDRFHNRYTITGHLRALTALHIGAGEQSFQPGAVDNPVVKDVLGRPYIPGSSLKGVWRSFTEQVLAAGWGRQNGNEACDISSHPCLQEMSEEARRGAVDLTPEAIYQRLCPACRLFGNQHFAGKVMVRDLPVVEDSWVGFYETRSGVGIDRGTRTKADKLLYDFECVPAGTRFALEVVAENLEEDAWYNLLLGLRAMAQGEIPLGGMVSRGLGRVRLEGVVISRVTRDNLVQALLMDRPARFTLAEALRAAGLPPVEEATISREALLQALAGCPEEMDFAQALALLRQAERVKAGV